MTITTPGVRNSPETGTGGQARSGRPATNAGKGAAARNRRAARIRERKRAERARRNRVRASRAIGIDSITYRKSLNYVKHAGAERYYVRVMNRDTNELVREVPSREELDRVTRMRIFLRRVYSIDL